jgi:hypothetical protein
LFDREDGGDIFLLFSGLHGIISQNIALLENYISLRIILYILYYLPYAVPYMYLIYLMLGIDLFALDPHLYL